MATPDLSGFIERQDFLRSAFGVDVTLRTPAAPTWDPAEPIDPETGRPYDPFAVPTSGEGFTEETVTALVIDPLGVGEDETVVGPAGRASTDVMILSFGIEDRAAVQAATEAIVRESRYRISEVRLQRSRIVAFLERA
jgi:hypothetical protein